MEKYHVLLIDDSIVIRGMMKAVLEKDKEIVDVTTANCAADATAILSKERFDVAILDIEMPDINGLDYISTLQRLDIPVVMLSAQTAEGSDVRTTALLLGASACFNKANAVRDAASLIKIVKAAANHRVKLSAKDMAALASAKADAVSARQRA